MSIDSHLIHLMHHSSYTQNGEAGGEAALRIKQCTHLVENFDITRIILIYSPVLVRCPAKLFNFTGVYKIAYYFQQKLSRNANVQEWYLVGVFSGCFFFSLAMPPNKKL